MKELIKKILNEEVERKFVRLSPKGVEAINKMIGNWFKSKELRFQDPEETYGVMTAKFFENGIIVAMFSGYEDDEDDSTSGRLLIDREFVELLKSMFKVRDSLILHYITEYFEDNYLDMIEKEYGVTFYEIGDADVSMFTR
jgi:hypothetical protein